MKATLNGVILFVQNTEKLKSFYMDSLGLDLLEEIPSEWVLLKAGTSIYPGFAQNGRSLSARTRYRF